MSKFKNIAKKQSKSIRPEGYSGKMLHNTVGGWWEGSDNEADDIIKRLYLMGHNYIPDKEDLVNDFNQIKGYLYGEDVDPSTIPVNSVDLYLERKGFGEVPRAITGDQKMNYRKKK